jgi:DNA-binding GntR family transcriptional regulator
MAAQERLAELAQLRLKHSKQKALGEAVYRILREAILRELLPPGEVMNERVLAEALAVSRTPVREALQRLTGEGFLTVVPRQGLTVTDLSLKDIEEIYVMRAALEGVAARLSAQTISPSELVVLEDLCAQMAAATEKGEVERLRALNAQFHELLCGTARNRRLTDLVARLYDSVQRLRQTTLADPDRAREALREHEALLAAIRRRDPDEAERIARDHMTHAMLVRMKLYQMQQAELAAR